MCVVDRRTLPENVSDLGEYEAQGKPTGDLTQLEKISEAEQKNMIYVVTGTPGSDALVGDMLRHIWGVKRQIAWYKRFITAFRKLVSNYN